MANRNPRTIAYSLAGAFFACFALALAAQNQTALHVGPQPAPPPADWLGIIGEYGTEKDKVYVFEKDGSFHLLHSGSEVPLRQSSRNHFENADTHVVFTRSEDGQAIRVEIGHSFYPRLETSVSGGVFRITPPRSVAELTKEALAAQPPTEKGDFRKPDLVSVTSLDPSIKLDIRYASNNNFLGTPVYSEAQAFLQRPAAEAVVRANALLKPFGYGLLIHDAYRPWYVTKVFWDATPEDKKRFVADPQQGSRHNRGCAVDLSMYDLATGEEVEMTGVYDEMSERSYPNYPGGTSIERWRRDLLRQAMESQGFQVFEFEWWHFDYKDWQKYPILNIAFDALPKTALSARTLDEQIKAIMARPEFAHARFGIEFYSLDSGAPIYTLNEQQLFVPGSTTKLLTEGTALELFGADYRFHTPVYRTGPINGGTVEGDLVLVASGDPNLSNRIQPDGTLAFEDEDHSYGGPDSKGLKGDPSQVLKELARQIASKGIKKITGHIRVDATLFPEGEHELGTDVVISPIIVNDNLIDVVASPGKTAGAPVTLEIRPQTSYVSIINKATSGKAGSKSETAYQDEILRPDGTRSVTFTGTLPLGARPQMVAYRVPEPSRYSAVLLQEALKEFGVSASLAPPSEKTDFKSLSLSYKPSNLVAEHVSPPLSEEVRVTLKVSQNLHASSTPYLLGSLIAKKTSEIDQAGFDTEHDFVAKAGLDLTAASQSDGAGGNAYFTPDFIAQYLLYMSKQKDFDVFNRALPVLGKDGTLARIQVNSSAAGHVRAKTGTFAAYDALNKNLLVTGKGLAGYMETADGKRLILALYVNNVSVPMGDMDAMQKITGEALGEIASAAYDTPLPQGSAANGSPDFDVIIKKGRIVDGTGNSWISGDVGLRGDRITAVGDLEHATAKRTIDATGLVISPGFIDMLGQSELSLLIDNRSLSKLSQGITTEITGEGESIAPQTLATIAEAQPLLDRFKLKVDWTTLDQYLKRLEKTGTPLNIGTYVGAAQIRKAVLGNVDRAPTPAELDQMRALVEQAMRDGAFGISTALIYPPGHYAKTDELIELANVASEYGGIYGTHMRSEGTSELQALNEALRIGREAHIPVEIFHLKVSGAPRWGSMPKIVGIIQAARDGGQDVSADMYPYVAGGTALASSLPPWVAEGGVSKMLTRLEDAQIRRRIKSEMAAEHADWENLYLQSGGAKGVLVSGIENSDLKKYDGMTLAKIAALQQKDPVDTLIDVVIADKAQTGALYFIASEADLKYGLKQSWTSLCLDAGELSLDGPLYEPHSHPRAFGAMPRFLGRYVRDEHLLPLEQAVRKMTSLPAGREHLINRGLLKPGYFADITVFDPSTIIDHATYEKPTQLSEGAKYVFVNGELEYEDGKLTGLQAGKPLRGPGWIGRNE